MISPSVVRCLYCERRKGIDVTVSPNDDLAVVWCPWCERNSIITALKTIVLESAPTRPATRES